MNPSRQGGLHPKWDFLYYQVKEDGEGIQTMQTLGKNMAWLLKKIHG